MKERPILFSGDMVCAILDGRKTQTRRVVKFPIVCRDLGVSLRFISEDDADRMADYCQYGKPGDRLWVRETWAEEYHNDAFNDYGYHRSCAYRADMSCDCGQKADKDNRWKPSIHMSRSDSRITLEITGVRVERLNDIERTDAIAEGCVDGNFGDRIGYGLAISSFINLWESIYGEDSWNANPWVWVIEFRRVK